MKGRGEDGERMGRGWGEDGERMGKRETKRRGGFRPDAATLGRLPAFRELRKGTATRLKAMTKMKTGNGLRATRCGWGKKTRPLDGPIGTVCLFFGGAVQSGNPRSRFETSRRRRSRAFTAQDLGRRSIPVRLLAGKTPLQIQSGEQAKAVFLGLAAGVAQRRLPRGCEMAAAAGLGEALLEASRAARGGDLCGHRNSFCVFA